MNNEKLQHLQERIEKILVEVSTGFSNEYEYDALVGELGCLISKIDVLEGQVKELREALELVLKHHELDGKVAAKVFDALEKLNEGEK